MQRSSAYASNPNQGLRSPKVVALPSSLGARAAPTLPSPTTTYEPLAKAVLAQRFARQVLSISLGVCCIFSLFWTSWDAGSIGSLGLLSFMKNCFSPSTISLTVMWMVFAVLPIAILRKRHIQASNMPSLSPSQTIYSNIKDARYVQLIGALYASALITTMGHTIIASLLTGGEADLGTWAGSRKHPLHLNGRSLFLVYSQIWAAILFWLRDVLRSRFAIQWARQDASFPTLALPTFIASLVSIALLSVISASVSLLTFGFLRTLVLPLIYRLPVIHGILRPFVAHFLRPTLTVTFLWKNSDVVLRAILLSLTLQMCWEVASAMFELSFSIPIHASEGSKTQDVILASGLMSSNPYFQLQALNELSIIASSTESTESAKRQSLFNDSKHAPTLWSSVCRQLLLLLGKDYQNFLLRGKSLPKPAAPAPVPKPEIINLPQTPLNKGNVYKAPRPSPLGALAASLASDGPLTSMLSQGPADQFDLSVIKANVLKPIRETITVSRTEEINAELASAAQSVKSEIAKPFSPVENWYSAWDRWFVRERVDRAAIRNLPHKNANILIVQALSHFVANSLREDGFGHVQRDIPQVLEAMTLFLIAVDAYHFELNALATQSETPIAKEMYLAEIARAGEWVDEFAVELRSGLGLIVNTFSDRLNKFRFPPSVAQELQKFADYAP